MKSADLRSSPLTQKHVAAVVLSDLGCPEHIEEIRRKGYRYGPTVEVDLLASITLASSKGDHEGHIGNTVHSLAA